MKIIVRSTAVALVSAMVAIIGTDIAGAESVQPRTASNLSPASHLAPCSGDWTKITDDSLASATTLLDVDGLSNNRFMAAGSLSFGPPTGNSAEALLRDSSGDWSEGGIPNVPDNGDVVYGTGSVDGQTIWAVGQRGPTGDGPMALYWDGSSWADRSPPPVSVWRDVPYDVHGASVDDVWAVGGYENSGGGRDVLARHWDGAGWTVHYPPSPGIYGNLSTVVAISSADVWAAGVYGNSYSESRPLLVHWDGSAWSQISSPHSYGFVSDLHAFSASDVWAVGGSYASSISQSAQPTALHFDGSSWSVVPMPGFPGSQAPLSGLAAISTDDLWAAGYRQVNVNQTEALLMRWDGSAWTVVPAPLSETSDILYEIAAAAGRVVAVGNTWNPDTAEQRSLILECPAATGSLAVGGTVELTAKPSGRAWGPELAPVGAAVLGAGAALAAVVFNHFKSASAKSLQFRLTSSRNRGRKRL